MFHPPVFVFLLCLPTVLSVPSVYSKVSESPDAKRVVEVRIYINETRDGKQVLGNTTICSGVLLAEDIVATAAHCRHPDWPLAKYFVRLGEQEVPVASYYGKTPTLEECNDNALLILEKNITVQTASPLYVYCGEVSDLEDCAGYGYGLTEHNAKSREVREAHYTVRKRQQSDEYGTNSCLMASYHSKAKMCYGDSGGPTICKFQGLSTLVGVSSQIQAYVDGTSPKINTVEEAVSFCKLSSDLLLAKSVNMIRLLNEIPGGDRKYILNRIKTMHCYVK
ncbi:unnamed protein product [Bursaphelenchus xylophilus]|uniref:(pine wood nematode) hypothetical protein n=1 Tax=Bursaphelenchus xylophilus TaxID=6326 RepID=A0A1I7S5L6_BURXY|nr:unnamed protein product [Bursaphelenchus xylophilus]CAG9124845.1 unnamed protein product [Bursaphelenchus xylophilus]